MKTLNTTFEVKAPNPLDNRIITDLIVDLDSYFYKYDGMLVYVKEDDNQYRYFTASDTWVPIPKVATATQWGTIGGNITTQTDLMLYFDGYALVNHTHTTVPPHTHTVSDIVDLDVYTREEIDDMVDGYVVTDTGLLEGGQLIINSGDASTFDIAPGTFRRNTFTLTNPFEDPVNHTVEFAEVLGVTPNYLATHSVSYVGLSYDVGAQTTSIVQQETPFTNEDRRDIVVLGMVCHVNNTVIDVTRMNPSPTMNTTSQVHDVLGVFAPLSHRGNYLTAVTGTLNLDKTAGYIVKRGINYLTNPKDPNEKFIDLGDEIEFRYRTHTGNEGLTVTELDPNNWDNLGTITPVTADQYTVQRVFMSQDGDVRIQPGQQEYDSMNAALKASGEFPNSFIIEPEFDTDYAYIARIILKQGITDLDDNNTSRIVIVREGGEGGGNATPASGFEIIDDGNGSAWRLVGATGADRVTAGTSSIDAMYAPLPQTSYDNVNEIVSGVSYKIMVSGTTDWTAFGAADNNVGTVFTSNTTISTRLYTTTGYVALSAYGAASKSSINFGGYNWLDLNPQYPTYTAASASIGIFNYCSDYAGTTLLGSYNSSTNGYGNVLAGSYNVIENASSFGGTYGVALGQGNHISGNIPTALSQGTFGSAIGTALIVKSLNQTAVGISNIPWTGSQVDAMRPMFTVGAGDATTATGRRSPNLQRDIFNVLHNGEVIADEADTDTIINSDNDRILVTRELLEKVTVIETSTTLSLTQKGRIVFDSTGPITITIDSFTKTFHATFYNKVGAGDVTFVAGTASVESPDGTTLAAGKVASIFNIGGSDMALKGELS